ncbi:MAG: acetate kinase [Leptospiraceae bacterium]|nr:acetate kinase [Leptospiraceae bacterium]
MNILVINAGSSSIKFQLFNMQTRTVLADGMIERIGEAKAQIKYKTHQQTSAETTEIMAANHSAAMQTIIKHLTDPVTGVIRQASDVSAIGHRVVHGGEAFHDPALINETVLQAIRDHIALAPLHNPANLTGIEAARKMFPNTPQAAVFDTAFHQSLPRHAYHYAIPDEYYRKLRIRRYGFHGTSHLYVSRQAARFLNQTVESVNLITIHLGNGCSMAAVAGGKSIDTSMGLTPLEGLMMGSRCGDIDPALPFFLADNSELEYHQIDELLNKQSGLKGLTGTNDMRDILKRYQKADPAAILAVQMYAYRIKKYIGAYYAVLGRLDAIVFTAGIGENAAIIRELATAGLTNLGLALDSKRNHDHSLRCAAGWSIQTADSKIKILVVPTNEELEIAEQTLILIQAKGTT